MNDENRLLGKQTSDVIKAPTKSWLHSDDTIQEGITYNVKYIGCIGINESMKSLSFEVRTQVARESIRRVAQSAKLLNLPRRSKKNDEQINRILSTTCITQWTGMNVQLHINTQFLRVTQLECNDILFQHTMQNISFACGGDTDIQDFVAYVAKDDVNGRACYVFECDDNLANNVITTVGQAFELRFRKFLNSMPSMKSNSNTNTINKTSPSKNLEENHKFINSKTDHHNHNHHHHHQQQQQQNQNHRNQHTPVQNEIMTNKVHPPTKKFNPNEFVSNTPTNGNNQQQQSKLSNQTPNAKISHKIDEKLEKMAWFHGLMTRETAEKLLVRDGDYLVRETNKAERQYVLSGRYRGECRHIFLVDPSGVVRTKDRVFDNICHLIQYHQENNIPIISKENELLLEHPVCK